MVPDVVHGVWFSLTPLPHSGWRGLGGGGLKVTYYLCGHCRGKTFPGATFVALDGRVFAVNGENVAGGGAATTLGVKDQPSQLRKIKATS